MTGREGITSLGHLPVIDLSRSKLSPVQVLLKEAFDYGVASIILLLLSPLLIMCVAALWMLRIRPLFTVEERIGRGGRIFQTARFNTGSKECFISEVMKRSGLDRLPRLAAVLRGEMSLVGPRGQPPGVVAENPPWERLLLEVKPGLTGLWLVGRAGDIHDGSDVEFDFYYLRNRSFVLDLVILMRTIPALWKSEQKHID